MHDQSMTNKMVDQNPFYIQRRFKELRSLIRNTNDFSCPDSIIKSVVMFFDDLVDHLSSQSYTNRDKACNLIVECMAELAKARLDKSNLTPTELWKWPVTEVPSSRSDSRPEDDVRWLEFSALKMFGYTVGKTNGWPPSQRQQFLSDFMEMKLPDMVEDHFGDEYGNPLSTKRLRKIANIIASCARNFYRNDNERYAVAIIHWKEDLEFLKRKYYYGRKLAFEPWPDVQV